MTAGARIVLVGFLVMTAACAGERAGEGGDGSLRVERITEGGIEVVRNLSGSKWGGNATLEVVLEIGIDEGDERYMFNNPSPFWATEEEIYVVEGGDGKVRVYGLDGQHRRDFGNPGQGPGELENPTSISVTPSGRVAVTSSAQSALRTAFFTREGEFVEEWRSGETSPGPGLFVLPFVVAPLSDSVAISVVRLDNTGNLGTTQEVGVATFGADGYQGEAWFAPPIEEQPATYPMPLRGITFEQPVPWSIMRPVIAVLPDGSRIWAHGDRYRFHIVAPDGGTVAVERVTDPVPIDPDEAEYTRLLTIAQGRRFAPDFNWNGSGMPEFKPWITMILTDPTGRIWVAREGPGTRVEPCTENPTTAPEGERIIRCWRPQRLLDIFDRNGDFLGSLERPEGLDLLGPFMRGDMIVAGYEDEFGVNKVRVYRLVLPVAPD